MFSLKISNYRLFKLKQIIISAIQLSPPNLKIISIKQIWLIFSLFVLLEFDGKSQERYVQQGDKIVSNQLSGAVYLGGTIQISRDGNTAIVGTDNQGAVIFTKKNNLWIEESTLLGTGNTDQVPQGKVVSISGDGNTSLVGWYNNQNDIGAVWIFARIGSIWSQQGEKLIGTGIIRQARQGCSAAISVDGNTVIVGGSNDNNGQGAAWIFVRSGSTWSQQGEKLVGTGNIGAAGQGQAVAISENGNTAVVSGDNDNSGLGAVWVFVRSGTSWSQQGEKLIGTGNIGKFFLGKSISISDDGNTIVAGGNNDNSSQGAAWVFARTGTTWSQQGEKLIGIDMVGKNQLGRSSSISGDGSTIILGGAADNAGVGAAWIFKKRGTLWTQFGNKLIGSGTGKATQGSSVSISGNGNSAIVGGSNDNNYNGAFWIFENTLFLSLTATPITTSPGVITPLNYTLKNNQSSATSSANVYYYLSTDIIYDPNDQLISELLTIPTIAGNGSQVVNASLSIPSSALGKYYILPVLNVANADYQYNVANVIGAIPFTVGAADLIFMGGPGFTYTFSVGDSLKIGTQPLNIGDVNSAKSIQSFYLSSDSKYDILDQLISNIDIPVLPPQSSILTYPKYKIPLQTPPGQYFLISILNSTNTFPEDHSNDTTYKAFTVTAPLLPDLRFGSADGPLRQFTPGDSITIGSTIVNGGNETSGLTNVQYVLSTDDALDANDQIIGASPIPFIPGGTNFILPSQKYLVPKTVAAGQYRLLFVVDRGSLVAESDETNNIVSLSANVAVPDLTINYNTATPLSGLPGDPVSLSCVVQSSGPINAKASILQILLSTDTIPGAGDYNVSAPIAIDALGINGSSNLISVQYNIPTIIPPGNYYFLFVADATNTVVESKENNNVKYLPFQVSAPLAPDLTISLLSVISATPNAGEQVLVHCTVDNPGSLTALESTLQYYFSKDRIVDAADTKLPPIAINSVRSMFSTQVADIPFVIPAGTAPGTYYFLFVADAENVIAESNETNNMVSLAVTVSAPLLPDERISKATSDPAILLPGAKAIVNATVVNDGKAVSGGYTVQYFYSADAVFDASDRALSMILNGAPLLPGASAQVQPWEIALVSDLPAGPAFIFVLLNQSQVYEESDYTNNIYTIPITIAAVPDLIVASRTASPTSLLPGDNINLSAVVQNVGNSTSPGSTFQCYISSIGFYDATAKPILTAVNVPALAVNESYTFAASVYQIPITTSPGAYYILFVSDAGNTIAESIEGNNVWAAPISVGGLADLSLSTAISAPEIVLPGTALTIRSTIDSKGSIASGTSKVHYYLSSDAIYSSNDTPILDSLPVPALPASTSYIVPEQRFIIPAGTAPGIWFIVSVADVAGAVRETNEGNNTAAASFTVNSFPDLTVSAPVLSASALLPGGTLGVSGTVKNTGGTAAGEFFVQYYLSSDAAFSSADDIALGQPLKVSGLAVSTESAIPPLNFTFPETFVPGKYYVIAVADGAGAIKETSETNNTAASALFTLNTFAELTVSAPVLSSYSMLPGETLGISGTVKNTGGTAASEFFVQYYLSSDAAFSSADDMALGQPLKVTGLATATETALSPIAYTFPETFTPGKYYVIAVTDEAGAVKETSELNNTSASALLTLNAFADLTLSAPVLSPSGIVPGNSFKIDATVKNSGGTLAPEFLVQYYISSDNVFSASLDRAIGEPLKVSNLGIGLSASVPTFTYAFSEAESPGTYYIFATADEAGAIKESNESNNTSLAAVLTVHAFADLLVSAPVFTAPHLLPGESISLVSTVTNSGGTDATEFFVKYYLSPDNVLGGAGDIGLGEAVKVSSLAFGTSTILPALPYTLPLDFVPGKYFVFAVVDEAGVVKESNESNNSSSAPLTVFAFADLSVSAPSFTAPHLLPGESISLSSTISNSGPTDAAGFAVQYYLSADAVLGGAVDILMGESVLVNSLAAGTSLDLSGSSYTLPLDFVPGKYFVIAVVDAGGMVRESNESNNTTSAPLTVFAFADLTVSVPSFLAPHLLPGEAISLGSTVTNGGATDATSFSVQYYLSSDAVLGGALDIAIGDPLLVSGLAAGVSLDLAPLRYQLPADFVPGKYFVIAQVDNGNLIYESNEANNTTSAPLTVFAFADLTISPPTFTAPHLLPSEAIKLSSVVSNRGETNATEFFVQYYLSSDSVLGTGKDMLLGEPLKVSSLAAGASLALTPLSYTLPLDFVPGKYFVIAVADFTNAIKESFETNNASSTPLRVFAFADLSVSSLLVSPAVLLPGSSFGVSSLVTNSGETAALGTKLHYYISTDALLDGADRPILDSVLLSSVAPGASFEVPSASFLVPLDFAPGNYFVLASIDILKASYESNELNNTASTPLLVQAFPDLVPTLPLITPATALLPLDVVSINSSVVNSGGTPAAAFGLRYYLSLNASLDAADILIAPEFTVPSLGHGLTATLAPLSFTLPDTLLPGTYYILASADQSLAVYESNEKNNVAASAFTVFAYADLMLVNAAATPLSLLPGESLSIAASLVNIGESDTRKSSSVQYFLSSDPLRDASDIALGAPTVMAPLDGGALAAVPAAAFAVPMGTVPGSYYILVSVNEERAFPERDFTNNLASIPLLVSVLPDYSVPLSGVQVSPAAVFAGDSLSIGCTLANSGGQSAGTIVSLEYFLSSDSLYSADDLPLGPIQLPLSPDSGSSSEISSRKVLLPISTPAGSYYVILASDLAGAVLEGSEANNNAYFKIAVSALPDLTATVAASPLKLVTGETVLMSASVHNSGSDAAPFSVQYFFSSDLTLDIADSPISEPILVAGGLALGAGYALPPFSYTIPQGTYAGTYYVLVSTDAKKVIRESRESNNLGFVKLSIVYPDLADLSVADAFVAPSLVVAGDSLSLECTLKNIGTAAPLASSTLRYLLSIDASPDSSDLVLASFPIAGLAPGDALAFNLSSFAVPPFVPSGKYFVLLVSDADHVLSEANEGNNTAVLSIQVAGRADLSFSAATASSKALFAGDTLFISSTVKNSGAGTTQRAVTMQYYLSSDSLFDIADLPLGNGMSIGKLSQGRALSFSGSFPLPLSLEGGDYFLLLYADNTALIKEASEENNMAVLPLKVRPFSELHVNGPLAIPARVYPGDNATFSAEVENTGPGKPDSAFQVMFFLSEDKLFDEGDVPVSGLLAAPALAPGQHKTFGVQYNFSPSTLPGTYYVLVVADGGKLVRESDETNNIGMAVIQVGNPLLTDLVVNAFVLDPTLVAGDSITVEATVSDSGLAAAVTASRFQYFISKDRLFDNSDVALGASIVIPALAIGEKVSFPRRKWRVPLSTAPGEYFLLAFADVTNKLSEADEENNIHPVPLHILPFPDLKVLRASASVSSLYIGDSVTMKASVGNIFGSETKRPVGLQYLLSSDALADPSDILLSSEISVPPLIVNDRIDTLPSLTLQVPDTIKGGYYYLLAFVDYKNQLIETNESNNFVAIPLTVKPRPVIIKPDSLLDSVSAKDVIRLNINVKSELPVASVSFTYRKVTDSLETVSRELPLGLSYSGAIPKTFLDEIGAEYFFLATDSSGNKSLLSKGSVAVEWPAPGLEIPYHSFGAAVKNYRVITIPLKLKVPAIDSVFYKPLGEYNKKKWRIYHYKDSSNREFLNGTSAMLAGDGYWFIAKDSTGNPLTSGPGSTVDATIEEPFRVTLKKGWNQVGNPYNMDIYWQDILAFKKNNPAVLADFKQWKGDWTEGDTLARMEGGFVLAAKNTTLYFPTIKRKVVPPGAAPFRLGNAESPSEDNWKLSFLLESKGQRYSLAGLGMHPKAALGKDDRDDLAPPRFLNYLEVVFDHPEYFYPRFTRDIVPAADAHVWDFDVASEDAGTKTLSWDAPLFSGKMLLLYDREAERAISMEKLSSYTFESGSSRHMRVYYGSPESIEAALAPSTITLSNPYPNPYSESASVSLSLPPLGEAYSLDLALYNALGQKVNTIAGGTFAHGFHEFSLSSISTAGERLPQGIYILRLEVNGKGASREIARKVMIK